MKLYFVTGNPHKVREASLVAKECGIQLVPASAPKIEVQSMDVREVARIAALTAYLYLREPLVVEDTGLYIEALNGFPGALAAHVYETIGIQGILRLMEGVKDRRARFVTALALVKPPEVIVVEAETRGVIAEEPRGSQGFGYDPIFIPEGANKTYAEMTIEEKNRYSHRAKAFRELCRVLRELGLVEH